MEQDGIWLEDEEGCWLTKSESELLVEDMIKSREGRGFKEGGTIKALTCSCSDRHGGGVALYLNNNLDFNKLSDLEINDDIVCQSIFVELNLKKSSTIIGVVYRPPNGDIKKFNDYINNTLSKLNNSKKSIYIMGDFNINLLNSETCNLTSDFFEIMLSHSLCPTIFRPTRITTYSATLIDNIFPNNYSQPVTSGILLTDILDHLPIFLIMDESIPKA